MKAAVAGVFICLFFGSHFPAMGAGVEAPTGKTEIAKRMGKDTQLRGPKGLNDKQIGKVRDPFYPPAKTHGVPFEPQRPARDKDGKVDLPPREAEHLHREATERLSEHPHSHS